MSREEIVQNIVDKFREMSTETVMFHQVLADELGLHISDHKCMDIIHRFGAMPAGRLGEMTGLTTGAITGMVDRLEKAGHLRRTNDPKDRRKTIVEPIRNKKLERKIEMIFIPLHERIHKVLCSYSDSELTLLLDVMTELVNQTREESNRLRSLRKKSDFST
jgi:DNA-binding MarR family transcriptional regulator